MADRWAVVSGNWSNTATWNGGTLPSPGDDVYANAKTVTIDQDIVVNSLKNVAGTGISTSGHFRCAGDVDIEITAGIAVTDIALDLLDIYAAGGAIQINANMTGERAIFVNSGYAGTITVNGDVVGTTGSDATVYLGSGGMVVNGDVCGGSESYAYGVTADSGTTLEVHGSIGSFDAITTAIHGVESTAQVIVSGDAYGLWIDGIRDVKIAAGESFTIHMRDTDDAEVLLSTSGGGGGTIPTSGVIWPPRYYG